MLSAILFSLAAVAVEPEFVKEEKQLRILLGEQQVATYVWEDAEIPRPYFCNVFAADGTAVSRTHPPDPVKDKGNDDHASFHPGIWLAFGDLGGEDFWRLKARVRHVGFVEAPRVKEGVLRFAVRNVYETLATPVQTVAEEVCHYLIAPDEEGYFICARSAFTSERDVAFGDQEEMGFGLRLATGLTVKHGGGALLNSEGGKNEAGTWGKGAAWLMGSKTMEGKQAGAIVLNKSVDAHKTHFHSRDYGLIVANSFAHKAFYGADDPNVMSKSIPLTRDSELLLTYGVYVFSAAEGAVAPAEKHARFLELLAE